MNDTNGVDSSPAPEEREPLCVGNEMDQVHYFKNGGKCVYCGEHSPGVEGAR